MPTKRKPPKKPPVGTPRPVEHRSLTPPIERVPGVGRTWIKRGFGYWTLRSLIALMFTFMLVFGVFSTGAFGYTLWKANGLPIAVKVVLMAVLAAAVVHSSIKAWRSMIVVNRSNRTAHPVTLAEAAGDKSSPRQRRRAGMSSAFQGASAVMGAGLSGGLILISVVANFGWFVVIFIAGFQRYYLGEAAARARLQQWCDQHEVPTPLSA